MTEDSDKLLLILDALYFGDDDDADAEDDAESVALTSAIQNIREFVAEFIKEGRLDELVTSLELKPDSQECISATSLRFALSDEVEVDLSALEQDGEEEDAG